MAADTGLLPRLRLQMALRPLEEENLSYERQVFTQGRCQHYLVWQWKEDEDSPLRRREQLLYPKRERDGMNFWDYSRELHFIGPEGTTLAFVRPELTRLLRVPWEMRYPYYEETGEYSSEDLVLQGQSFWLIRHRGGSYGTEEDFLVERSPQGGCLRRWRIFTEEGELQETHLYENFQELPLEQATWETFLPPQEGPVWEAENSREYHAALLEIRRQESEQRKSTRKIPLPRLPRSWEGWNAILTTPVRSPSRLLLLGLAALAAALPFLPRRKKTLPKAP